MGTRGRQAPRTPAARARGQASVLGTVLVLGMVVTGTVVVVALGATALTDVQSTSELERAENSMTLFNTRAAMVALGESGSRTVAFDRSDGTISAVGEDGWMRIVHTNHSGTGNDELLFNESLGAVVYRSQDTKIGYQGGGVWRKDADGEGLMVSPPEFHYRGQTLTLPIIRVRNADGNTGGTTATVDRVEQTRLVFPNATAATPGTNETGAPYDNTDKQYANPVRNGSVSVTVSSQYYQGWASYFRGRTDGNVTVNDSENRVRVTLTTPTGSVGEFGMPSEGNQLGVSGLGSDHPLQEYTLNLSADNEGKNFNNMHWSFYADQGNEQFELHFYSSGKCQGNNPAAYNGDIDVSLYYRNTSGGETVHEEWQNTSVNANDTNDGASGNDDFRVNCDDNTLDINLLSDTTLTYDDIQTTGSDNKWQYGTEISDTDVSGDTNSFTFHDSADSGNYSTGQTEQLGFLISHYFQLLGPSFNLEVTDGPGGSSRIDEGSSTGNLEFESISGDQYITYLHITENTIEVEFD